MEIVGGTMPDLEPGQSDYYIQLRPTWKEDVMLNLDVKLGFESSFSWVYVGLLRVLASLYIGLPCW